ncbi:protein-tyrosine phosphatase-like protein [Corynascus novoguineensis]|uniref:Protein-tyrosine phosphatase-like protein n=1 Tax=Corynascus novoguineensis TaxID=1126955 RepID=A0AAN7CVI8_9PEZI|nr:protein-tyrosine phosphatase-like protein [Corynascus novoguineensis]
MAASSNSDRATVPPDLPSPPFLHVPGLANLRDAGGYAIQGKPGKAVRRGVIFRSADLTQLEDEGVAVLRLLGITHVFDLRSVTELEKAGHPPPKTWEGAARVFVPVFLDKDYSPEALALRFRNYSDGPEGFVKAYGGILASAAEPDHPYSPFRTVLEHVASSASPPAPFLVHCTAGKDRTGVLVALLLALCGADDDTIAREYSLTDLGLAPRREEIVQHLMAGEALFGDRKRAERMVGAQKENMLGTLALIRERYGSAESYVVNHLGMSQASVERIRQNLVVNLADGEKPLDCTTFDAKLKEAESRL